MTLIDQVVAAQRQRNIARRWAVGLLEERARLWEALEAAYARGEIDARSWLAIQLVRAEVHAATVRGEEIEV